MLQTRLDAELRDAVAALRQSYSIVDARKRIRELQAALAVEQALLEGIAADELLEPQRAAQRQAEADAAAAAEAARKAALATKPAGEVVRAWGRAMRGES